MKTSFTCVLLLLLVFFLIGCKTKKDETTKEEGGPGSTKVTKVETSPDPPRLAQSTVESIGVALEDSTNDIELDILTHLKACAMSQLIAEGLLESTDTARISIEVFNGIMLGLGDFSDQELSKTPNDDSSVESPNKKAIIKIVLKDLISDLLVNLSDEKQNLALGELINTVSSHLGSAGISKEDMALFSKEIIHDSLSALSEGEVDEDVMLNLAKTILQCTIGGVGHEKNELSVDQVKAVITKSIQTFLASLTAK